MSNEPSPKTIDDLITRQGQREDVTSVLGKLITDHCDWGSPSYRFTHLSYPAREEFNIDNFEEAFFRSAERYEEVLDGSPLTDQEFDKFKKWYVDPKNSRRDWIPVIDVFGILDAEEEEFYIAVELDYVGRVWDASLYRTTDELKDAFKAMGRIVEDGL